MAKSIVGIFQRGDDAHGAAHDLLSQGISPEHISLIIGEAEEVNERNQDVKTSEAAGAMAAGSGAILASLTAFAIPAIGTVLAAGAAATGLGAALNAETDDEDAKLRHILQTTGLMEEQIGMHAQELRRGRAVLAVSADEDQSDLVADILRRQGGEHLDSRRRKV
jgi:hypothetical protein